MQPLNVGLVGLKAKRNLEVDFVANEIVEKMLPIRHGREHVRQNFLLTRHVKDYLCLAILARAKAEDDVLYLAPPPPGVK